MSARLCTLTVLSLFTASCDILTGLADVPPVATAVNLSPSTLSFNSVGASQQLTASVKDQIGVTMTGVPVTWGVVGRSDRNGFVHGTGDVGRQRYCDDHRRIGLGLG